MDNSARSSRFIIPSDEDPRGDYQEDVSTFMSEVLGVPLPVQPAATLKDGETNVDMTFLYDRLSHLAEELGELADGIAHRDLLEVADALVDIVYVTVGLAALLGIPFDECWSAVHAANMQKIRGEREGREGHRYDAIKPEGWQPANLQEVIHGSTEDPTPCDTCGEPVDGNPWGFCTKCTGTILDAQRGEANGHNI